MIGQPVDGAGDVRRLEFVPAEWQRADDVKPQVRVVRDQIFAFDFERNAALHGGAGEGQKFIRLKLLGRLGANGRHHRVWRYVAFAAVDEQSLPGQVQRHPVRHKPFCAVGARELRMIKFRNRPVGVAERGDQAVHPLAAQWQSPWPPPGPWRRARRRPSGSRTHPGPAPPVREKTNAQNLAPRWCP